MTLSFITKSILFFLIIFCTTSGVKAQHIMRFQSNFLDQHKDFTLPLKAVCWFKNESKQLLIIDSIVGDSQIYSHKENASTVLIHDVNDLKKMRVHRKFNNVRDGVLVGLYGIDILLVGGGMTMMALSDSYPPEANAGFAGLSFVFAGVITTGVTLIYSAITKNTYRTNSFYIQGFYMKTWHRE